VHDRTVEHDPGGDEPLVDAAESRDDLFYCALVSNLHHDRVHLLQLRLSLDQFLLETAGDRNDRAFKESLVGGYPLAFSSGIIARLDVLCAGHSPTPPGS
jgi:hypothetical protein